MTPELLNIQHYMTCQGRKVRYRPPTGIPAIERFTQMERMLDALWTYAATQGIHLGNRPPVVLTGAGLSPVDEILRHLAELEIEVGAAALMTGLGDAITTAIFETAKNTPYDPSKVNYSRIITDIYDEEAEPDSTD